METCIATLVSDRFFLSLHHRYNKYMRSINRFFFSRYRLWAKYDSQMRERKKAATAQWHQRNCLLEILLLFKCIVLYAWTERNKSHEFIDFEKCISSILSNIDLKWLCECEDIARSAMVCTVNIEYNPNTTTYIVFASDLFYTNTSSRHIVIIIWFNSITHGFNHFTEFHKSTAKYPKLIVLPINWMYFLCFCLAAQGSYAESSDINADSF